MTRLMLKSLMLMLLISSNACAKSTENKTTGANSDKDILEYVKKAINVNSKFKLKDVRVADKKPLEQLTGWSVYFLDIDLAVQSKDKKKDTITTVHDKIFSNGVFISRDFIDIKKKSSLKDKIAPDIDSSFEKKENLVYGEESAPNKIVVFSDPLCPFCQSYMPKLLKAAKENPKKIALYYYNFPLTMLHKASPTIIKAVLVAEKNGEKDMDTKVYSAMFDFDTTDEKKILEEFNKKLGLKISEKDIMAQDILVKYSGDIEMAGKAMVSGTPTVYVNGKKDFSREKYIEIIK